MHSNIAGALTFVPTFFAHQTRNTCETTWLPVPLHVSHLILHTHIVILSDFSSTVQPSDSLVFGTDILGLVSSRSFFRKPLLSDSHTCYLGMLTTMFSTTPLLSSLCALFFWALLLNLSFHATIVLSQSWSPIVVKTITQLGPQLTPDVTNVSRDGGHSVLLNGNILWIYDDTECMGYAGEQLSFISNTAAYANRPDTDICTVHDFGVEMVGEDQYGRKQYAILADETVGTGGWIPFRQDELDFNNGNDHGERVAICK